MAASLGRRAVAAALSCAMVMVPAVVLGADDPSTSDADAIVVMERLYNPWSGEHFYTSSDAEVSKCVSLGWRDEGIAWYAPESSSTPVYRLYNPFTGDHHYTMSVKEYEKCGDAGWNNEGIGWYSDDAESAPLYRQYNPYAVCGTHNYTVDKAENDSLVGCGWKAEGVAWYGLKGKLSWTTSDGRVFDSEDAAEAHAQSTVPTVSESAKDVAVWETSDGYTFSNEADAAAHAEACRLAVSARTKTVHHDAVTHTVWHYYYAVGMSTDKYHRGDFLSSDEALQYWEDMAREHEDCNWTGGVITSGGYNEVVTDQAAYDEVVTYWVTSDGNTFDTEAEADVHAATVGIPTVSESTKPVVVYVTSDGAEFDTESAAQAYANAKRLSVSKVWVNG